MFLGGLGISGIFSGKWVYMAGNQTEESFVFYNIDEKNSIAVLTLNSCGYNEEYKNCLKEMFTEIKKFPSGNFFIIS